MSAPNKAARKGESSTAGYIIPKKEGVVKAPEKGRAQEPPTCSDSPATADATDKGQLAAPPVIHSFGESPAPADTPLRTMSTGSTAYYEQAKSHFADANAVANAAGSQARDKDRSHLRATMAFDTVEKKYRDRVACMKEDLERLIQDQDADLGPFRHRLAQTAGEAQQATHDYAAATAHLKDARAHREAARTAAVVAAETAGMPLLPKATPPTRPFSSPPPAAVSPSAPVPSPATQQGDEDAAACLAFTKQVRKQELRARLPELSDARLDAFLAADYGAIQRPPLVATGLPTTTFSLSGVNGRVYDDDRSQPPQPQAHMSSPGRNTPVGSRYQSPQQDGRDHGHQRRSGGYETGAPRHKRRRR